MRDAHGLALAPRLPKALPWLEVKNLAYRGLLLNVRASAKEVVVRCGVPKYEFTWRKEVPKDGRVVFERPPGKIAFPPRPVWQRPPAWAGRWIWATKSEAPRVYFRRRVALPARPTVRRPEDLHALLHEEFRGLDRERFLGLYLDTRHRLAAVETVSVGSLNASLVHPREVFKPAVAMSAAAVIVAHNHPSGDAGPSGDDLDLTARLDRCGDLLGIALLDHLVVGSSDIISIREYGWPTPPGE